MPTLHDPQLLEDLNEPQKVAVLHGEGSLLVLAGAGSGKTRVITRRVAHLVRDRKVFPWRILAVTFTNKAAREMKARLGTLLGAEANELFVSTFHSASARILRREAERLGLTRSFVIYDDADQLQLVKRAMKEARIDSMINPREILHRIDQEKNAARLPEEMRVDPRNPRDRAAQHAYFAYQKLLKAANAVDFGDLLLLLVKLLRDDAEARAFYQQRFSHVLVDEFQDTNPVQYELLKLISPPGSNLCVVGDDDQSIYRWRGAEVDNILNFPKVYPGTRVVKLEQNYRSDQIILEAANAVISRNPRRLGKKLWSQKGRGEKVKLLASRDERSEAQQIAETIHELHRGADAVSYDSIAVFYRTNAQSRVLEEAMRLGRVPYTLVNGRSFYDRAEVRDAAAYLRLMVNPRSDADLLRVINTPTRSIGETTVERLTDFATQTGKSLYEALSEVSAIPALNATSQKRLAQFRILLDALVSDGAKAPDAATAVERMFARTGLIAALQAENTEESNTRAENLREFLGAAQEFDLSRSATLSLGSAAAEPPAPVPPASGGAPASVPQASPTDATALDLQTVPLQAFLEQISLVGDADAEVGEGRAALMTLHAAKGLEFDAVFIAGMEDGVFPHQRALEVSAPEEEMAEERRLCYVGFTRARKRLFVSLAQSRSLFGELRFNPHSRFLSEVPPELVDFEQELPVAPPRGLHAPSPARRRRVEDDEDVGPRIDRSYSQTSAVGGEDVVGMAVRHGQFGEGVILDCDGQGPNAKVTVRFQSVGLKRVIARFLSPVG